ncbi:MAG: metallophosphoesterase [Phycisphaerales bacterium]
MNFRSALVAVLLSLVLAAAPSIAQAPTLVNGTEGRALPNPGATGESFTVAIVPDRTTGWDWGLKYMEQAVDELNLIDPDAVFTVGDMVQGYTRSTERYERELRDYRRIVERLDAPFYPLPGNHDVISGERNPEDHTFERLYQQHIGPLFYAVHFDRLSAIALYTDEQLESQPRLSEDQIEWARAQIDRAVERRRPLLVLMHKPVWRYRDGNWDAIHQPLADAVESGVSVVVIAGHFHSLQREAPRDGVEYHLVGTCGGSADQHPFAGHLQHLTFVKFESGASPRVWHQPVGVTLADDFVLADDQSRAFRLKSWDDRFQIENVIDQPAQHPVRDELRVRVSNPIDRPITVEAKLLRERPGPTFVDGYSFTSNIEADLFNPYTWNIDTPFRVAGEVEPITLQPNEETTITIPLRCEAQPGMITPPQLHLTATFEDDHGRRVPVVIRRRIPLRMRYVMTDAGSLNMPIAACEFSVYDRPERNPELGIYADGDKLRLALVVYDETPCFAESRDATERVEDPRSDAVRLTIGEGPDETVYLIEPLGPSGVSYRAHPLDDGWRLDPAPEVNWESVSQQDGYGLIIDLPLRSVGRPGEEVRFNLEVADNDETYHTQWRQWSHPAAGSVLVLPSRF